VDPKVGCLMSTFSMNSPARRLIQPSSSRQRIKRLIAVGAAVVAFSGATIAPASAADPVPRFLPAKVPSGYSYTDYLDRTTPSSTIRFIRYLRNGTNTAAAVLFAEPAQKSDWDSFARILKGANFKATKVKALPAYTDFREGVRTFYWFEKNRIITSRTVNVATKVHVSINTSVVVSKLPDASFSLKKEPAGFATVYAGSTAALVGSFSRMYWTDSNDNELSLDVSSIDRRAIEVYFLSPFVTYGTTVVRGKPAYVIEESSYVEVWWEEQPGLLMEVSADDLTASALVEFADSIAPTDEATWQTFVKATPDPSKGGTTAAGGADIVGAGMADGVPWTARPGESASCLQFNVGAVANQACVKAPNSLGWAIVTSNGKTFVVGVAAANVATVSVRSTDGTELAKGPVGQVANNAVLRLFVVPLPVGPAATVSGLDAAGAVVSPPIAAGA
jgi:hypothetical protein